MGARFLQTHTNLRSGTTAGLSAVCLKDKKQAERDPATAHQFFISPFSSSNGSRCVSRGGSIFLMTEQEIDTKAKEMNDAATARNEKVVKTIPIISGERFGRLRAVERHKNRDSLWRCVCDCGHERIVARYALRNGLVVSCGCQKIERCYRHGLARTPEYRSWLSMMHRCYTSHCAMFKNYGGRGITVCPRWHDVRNFINDMGHRGSGLSLDRIDNDGNYEPGNCRWATRTEQCRNRRSNRFITIGARTMTLAEWIETTTIKPTTVAMRLSKGWEPERALYEPLGASR